MAKRPPQLTAETLTRRLGPFIRRAMRTWHVPGLAIGIVRRGRTILAKGYGLRDVRRALPVTDRTLFAIASCTKAFTATSLGILADEKKLQWDRPVREVLPGFRLADPVATQHATIRDLLCHRTGLPRHDPVWYDAKRSKRELLARLPHLPLSKDFRAAWQYQNILYAVAGLVLEQITGQPWEQFVRERILAPVGMGRSNLSVDESQKDSDVALPYAARGSRVHRTRFYEQCGITPAGGVNSCVADMTRWMLLNLGAGKLGRARIVSAETLREIHKPQMVMGGEPPWPEMLQPTYAMGWADQAYRGRRMLCHGGGIDGFSSYVILHPRERIGIVVLTNLGGQPAPQAVVQYAQDLLLGARPAPWIRRLTDSQAEAKKNDARDRRRSARKRVRGTKPSHRLACYVGEFRHDGYGVLGVERKGRRLQAVFRGKAHRLSHYHYDVFVCEKLVWERPEKVSFHTDADGRIESLSVSFEPEVAPIVFRRADGGE